MKKARKMPEPPVVETMIENNNNEEWARRFVLTEHWQSDLKFFKDELRFLHRVIKRFLLWLNEDENILRTRSLVNRITEAEKIRQGLDDQVSKHMVHMREVMENPFAHDESRVREEHQDLERDFTLFVKNFRGLKELVFEDAERVIEQEEELNRFLGT